LIEHKTYPSVIFIPQLLADPRCDAETHSTCQNTNVQIIYSTWRCQRSGSVCICLGQFRHTAPSCGMKCKIRANKMVRTLQSGLRATPKLGSPRMLRGNHRTKRRNYKVGMSRRRSEQIVGTNRWRLWEITSTSTPED
jgi:hypothetical protein